MACKLSDLAERSDPSYMDDKRAASQDEFVLERVQGLTSTTLHSLASNPTTGWVAFPAACVLVLLDPKTNEQKFIESPSLRNISCCAFTDDGRFVAFGETGMKPHIAMWNLREHKECYKFVTDTTVRAIFLHPISPTIVSLSLKENVIDVWDYVKGMRMASCKWQTIPLSVTIPRTGSSLVVCGHRKITLFNISKVDSNSHETNVFQDRKTVLLGKQSEYTFVDVESGRGQHERTVYTVTSCGYLCEIKLGDILIDKAIKVDTQTFCVRYSTELLFVGCPAGVVKICDPDNLSVTAAVSLSSLLGPSAMPKVGNKFYLDVCTLVVDENEKIVTCVYADCSMHSWQIGTDGEKIVCSAIEPAMGYNGVSGHPTSKSNLLRAFIGCCEKSKTCNDVLSKLSIIEQNKPPQQFGGRRLVNENRASYQNVNAVRFTPDGKDVICGNEEGEIKVYELSTGILRRVIEAHSSQVTCIEVMYDKDFQLVCSGGRDRVMFVLNAKNDFSLVQVLCDHSAAITAISLVNHKGVLTLVSAAADNVILIRRAILGGTLRFTITGEIAQTNCRRSFFVTSDYIALGGKDSQIKVFKADPIFVSKPVKTIDCQKLSPSKVGFKAIDIDPSSSFMAVSQSNGNISVYHLQTGQPVASLPLQSDITNIHFTSDLKYMVSSTSNGCDLVWRLPERMTDFMQSKQDKQYQIETKKEVSNETYMSCVKVCKQQVQEDDDAQCTRVSHHTRKDQEPRAQHRLGMKRAVLHQRRASSSRRSRGHISPTVSSLSEEGFHKRHIAQNSSNHNSEWDRTPSIDSMSALDHCSSPVMFAEKTKGNRDGADGRSCSSCSSESIVNCSTCTNSMSTSTRTSCCSVVPTESSVSRTEPSHRLRFYCGTDHELFGQVIEEGRCTKVGHFKKIKNELSGTDASQHVANTALTQREMRNEESVEKLVSANPISASNKGERQNGNTSTETQLVEAGQTLTEKESTMHDKGSLNETEKKKKLANFEEIEDFREHEEDRSAHMVNSENKSHNTNNVEVPPTLESRFPKSSNILEKALFYEGVMRGDLKSARQLHSSSPTRQHTAAVGEVVRSLSKQKPDAICNSGVEEAAGCREASADIEASVHWTPLTTPDYSNTSSNITNLVPSSSSTLIELGTPYKTPKDGLSDELGPMPPEIGEGSSTSHTETESDQPTLVEERASTQMDPESLHSEIEGHISDDNADTAGKLLEISNLKSFSTEMSAGDDKDDEVLDLSTNLAKINLGATEDERVKEMLARSNESVVEASSDTCSEDPHLRNEKSPSGVQENQNTVRAYLNSDRVKEMILGEEEGGAAMGQTVLDQLEQEGFTVPEKYRSALRNCMQLSNSQETFATLRVDTNDLELMAFLSHALKKKLVAAGLVGLSSNEIDTLLSTGSDSAEARRAGQKAGLVPDKEGTSAFGGVSKTSGKSNLSSPDSEDLWTRGCNFDDQSKVSTVSEPIGASAVHERGCKPGPPCASDRDLYAQSDTLSGWNLRSPLGEAKRRMYKSIMSRLPCGKPSNRNRSNTDSDLETSFQAKIRSLIHDSVGGELPVSEKYLYLERSAQHALSSNQDDSANHSRGGSNKAECSGTKRLISHTSPRLPLYCPEKERHNFRTPQTKGAVDQVRAEKYLQRPWANGPKPSRLSPRQDCVRVAPRSISTPASANRREPFARERTAKRCPDSKAPCTASGGNTEERDNSKTESCASEFSRAEHCSESDSGLGADSHRQEKPMAEIFRDQDEYLRKLKEVRENFERSIKALSAERKSKQAAEERGRDLPRK
ncbi:hypothetical protein EGW08_015012 [Elysia chlorotica]|uniref:Uncharacterized protein n=1 Tax=Elysia chlorotica TaxID=188477 RepID=A0A433T6P0_ELYCH|nr:hypothetical protein EGW08_015012 [Elysia chlorotica]